MLLTDVSAQFVDRRIIKRLVHQNRKFSDAFIAEFCRRSVNTLNSFVNLTQKKMPGRMAGGLIYLPEVVFNPGEF